jgi:hypothetical protein
MREFHNGIMNSSSHLRCSENLLSQPPFSGRKHYIELRDQRFGYAAAATRLMSCSGAKNLYNIVESNCVPRSWAGVGCKRLLGDCRVRKGQAAFYDALRQEHERFGLRTYHTQYAPLTLALHISVSPRFGGRALGVTS